MVTTTLLVAGGVSIGVGLAFVLVARAIRRMPAQGDNRTALLAFAIWWRALGAYLVIQGILTLVAATGELQAQWYNRSRWLTIPILCTGVWGLTSYLLYIYTGSRRVFAFVGIFYAVVAVMFLAAHFTADDGIEVQRWLVTEDDSGALYQTVYFLIGMPPIAAAVAYLLLLRRTSDPAQRYRIALVATAILAYVGSGLVARIAASDGVVFVTLVLFGALAAAASLLAYHPPPRWRAWLEHRASDEARQAEEKRLSMDQRMAQLI